MPALLFLAASAGDAHAQMAGVANKPLPNVLLLVDTSGSMERMGDNSMPGDNRAPDGGTVPNAEYPFPNACAPGQPSNPNRWGMLLQALTGNLQPYYSCDAVNRATAAFRNEFKIANVTPYDGDYFLPYHRPLTGAALQACAQTPYNLPGAGAGLGVGPSGRGAGGDAGDFPSDAMVSVLNTHLTSQMTANSPIVPGPLTTCLFDQARDGQLDATRDFIRFGLMTFDNATEAGIGVSIGTPPSGAVDTTNPFLGQWSYVKSPSNPDLLGLGRPAGCPDSSPFEVGARHAAAPPWEGRMIRFPNPLGNIYDLQRTNDEIQRVLLGTRPYGATPIDGMMEDARDYLLFNAYGPNGTQPGHEDAYVKAGCRDQHIILLTDGAPNLDMRPACEGAGGQCPYPNRAAKIAEDLFAGTGSNKVRTYVIGFSVNGAGNVAFPNDGFPAPPPGPTNCKSWYASLGNDPVQMRNACLAHPSYNPSTNPYGPPSGSTAEACCVLNEIAYFGSGGQAGPFFAESQADLVLSFGRILGGVAKSATTRTVPGFAPAVRYAGQDRTGEFIASFIPNAQKVWSGEIDRVRSYCVGPTPTPQLPQSPAQGDSYATNTAAQAVAGRRFFVTAKGQMESGFIDSARTMRPYTSETADNDGIPDYTGTELSGTHVALLSQPNWAEALDIDDNTCKRSRDPRRTAPNDIIPGLARNQCTDVVWKFATAFSGPITHSGYDGFNVRCSGTGGLSQGFCSISGASCTMGGNECDLDPLLQGQVCVPECAALGAVFRSSPVIVGPPEAFVRDEGYRVFAEQRIRRRPTMYVSSTDGVLHAYKALAASDFDAGDYELWAFVPPAVMPKLASNYPSGQQILLDGTPTVRDVVWERRSNQTQDPLRWHTTLVAGLGAGGAGYYALNVTDTDCGGTTNAGACGGGGGRVDATNFTQATGAGGPHFLWQLTDIEQGTGDPAKPSRRARDGKQMVSLFGRETGQPAIATLQVDPDGNGARQIGVAILPGGIDGPPAKQGATYASCLRALNGGAPGFSAAEYDFSDPSFTRRASVRRWGETCASPVPGRGVTIVRLDTGEIIRHFGRRDQDVPQRIHGRTTNSPFDSPIIGTPAVYPNLVDAVANKIFVGDADGTIWRIDVGSPNPLQWRVTLFQDLVSASLSGSPGPQESQPVHVPPVLSLDQTGAIVINAATGDQENLVASTERNYVFSIREQRALTLGTPSYAQVRWYNTFENGERVTGPMTVFDSTLYFASFRPQVPAGGTCGDSGRPFLWGMDHATANTGGIPSGGLPRWCPIGSVDALTGACSSALTQSQDPTTAFPQLVGALIPGVTIRATQACATVGAAGDDPASITGATSTKFTLNFGASTGQSGPSGTNTPTAERISILRPPPRTPASIDAWAYVVD